MKKKAKAEKGKPIPDFIFAEAAPDLYLALREAVESYGKPGGPWNVPEDPGGWIARAKKAIRKAETGEGIGNV